MAKQKEDAAEIFIRKPSKDEAAGGSARRLGMTKKIPPTPEGYSLVYKPYGGKGPGYYFMLVKEI